MPGYYQKKKSTSFNIKDFFTKSYSSKVFVLLFFLVMLPVTIFAVQSIITESRGHAAGSVDIRAVVADYNNSYTHFLNAVDDLTLVQDAIDNQPDTNNYNKFYFNVANMNADLSKANKELSYAFPYLVPDMVSLLKPSELDGKTYGDLMGSIHAVSGRITSVQNSIPVFPTDYHNRSLFTQFLSDFNNIFTTSTQIKSNYRDLEQTIARLGPPTPCNVPQFDTRLTHEACVNGKGIVDVYWYPPTHQQTPNTKYNFSYYISPSEKTWNHPFIVTGNHFQFHVSYVARVWNTLFVRTSSTEQYCENMYSPVVTIQLPTCYAPKPSPTPTPVPPQFQRYYRGGHYLQ